MISPPGDFRAVEIADKHKGTAIERAAQNAWFLAGEEYAAGRRLEMPVVRTNNQAAISAEAIDELRSNNCRPLEASRYWEKLGDGPSFHTHGASAAYGSWSSTAYTLKGNPDVVILCHTVDVP